MQYNSLLFIRFLCYTIDSENRHKPSHSWEKSCGWLSLCPESEVKQMPRKPKRPCSYPGCPKLTDGRFCEEHTRLENKRYEKYGRDPAVRRRYGRAWKRIRDSYVKTPLSEDGTHDRSNLGSLCKSCHSRIHAERGDRWH